MIRAILIDDEAKALKILETKILKSNFDIEIVAATSLPKEGIQLIKELSPDLIFLDIDMPQLSGFDVLAEIESPDFEVIFVTAHNTYAIEAIKHCAIGYIVKPIDSDDLALALANAKENIDNKSALEKSRQLLQNVNKNNSTVVIPTQKGLSFFKHENIVRLEGIDGYTNIYINNDEPIMSSYNIGKFKKILNGLGFFQTHKSHLINLAYLRSYHNEGTISLTNGDTIPLSKTRKAEFLNTI